MPRLHADVVLRAVQLPHDTAVIWNRRLLTTAGRCLQASIGDKRRAFIQLSFKICDTAGNRGAGGGGGDDDDDGFSQPLATSDGSSLSPMSATRQVTMMMVSHVRCD